VGLGDDHVANRLQIRAGEVSYSISELANLLLIVPCRKGACRSQRDRDGRASPCLHDARHRRAHEQKAVSQCELSAIVLVLLDAVACNVAEPRKSK
jgi:hypothetical protein